MDCVNFKLFYVTFSFNAVHTIMVILWRVNYFSLLLLSATDELEFTEKAYIAFHSTNSSTITTSKFKISLVI